MSHQLSRAGRSLTGTFNPFTHRILEGILMSTQTTGAVCHGFDTAQPSPRLEWFNHSNSADDETCLIVPLANYLDPKQAHILSPEQSRQMCRRLNDAARHHPGVPFGQAKQVILRELYAGPHSSLVTE